MKKTALTIGLFSLVVVATSFANPTINSATSSYNEEGVITGQNQGRKLDFHSNGNQLKNNNQSEGFRQDRQSLGNTIKLD
ncbi:MULTISPECIES: hypothetical protein [unclassified Flavobacterium]|uniref:hypothetical protein n=1 Tax=unclassified Flavobacterium TaxID=196869 RepID=UPI000493130F|nr:MULTISPECIES: hypothetical protein [unclassified Flavobacterium]MBF4493618.1 hypothetical protein [Flavobacterium sp. MR2016-29]